MKTRRSRSRLRTKTDLDPRNHYTTAPLVINHANAIDLTEKAFLQANREHKQERDKRNLKLQINMRLMIMRKSSSLYSKGIIATGEQDQELNKSQTLKRATTTIYRVLGITPLDTPPNGPKHDTQSNRPKDGVVAP